MVQIERQPELRKLRAEEQQAFQMLIDGVDKTDTEEYLDWEEKHLIRQGVENEHLYLQGVKDGAKLVFALFDIFAPGK
jgi:hypothetical protein